MVCAESFKDRIKMSYDFYKRAAIVCRAIPYGKAATYGQIAMLCGRPRNAR